MLEGPGKQPQVVVVHLLAQWARWLQQRRRWQVSVQPPVLFGGEKACLSCCIELANVVLVVLIPC